MTRWFLPLCVLVLFLGCKRAPEARSIPADSASTAVTPAPAPVDSAVGRPRLQVDSTPAPLGAAEAVVRAFAAERLKAGDTLYVGWNGDADPPAPLLIRLRHGDVKAQPLSKRAPRGEALTLYVTPQPSTVDGGQVGVRWQQGGMGAGGVASLVQRGGQWQVVRWDWQTGH